MTHKLTKHLGELGLSTRESEVYLALLRLGNSVVGTLSKECSIPRATTYQILDRLIEEGLVMKIDKNNILTYFPEEPGRFLTMLNKESKELEAKKELAEKLIPYLDNLKNPRKTKPKVTYFEGLAGYKDLLGKSLEGEVQTLRVMTNSRYDKKNLHSSSKLEEIMEFEEKEFQEKRVLRGIKLKLLTNEGGKGFDDNSILLRETRYLPEDFGETETFIVFGKSVMIITDNHPLIGVHIEEEQVAIMMKNMYDFIWKKI